jgi:hypothetical protein
MDTEGTKRNSLISVSLGFWQISTDYLASGYHSEKRPETKQQSWRNLFTASRSRI